MVLLVPTPMGTTSALVFKDTLENIVRKVRVRVEFHGEKNIRSWLVVVGHCSQCLLRTRCRCGNGIVKKKYLVSSLRRMTSDSRGLLPLIMQEEIQVS